MGCEDKILFPSARHLEAGLTSKPISQSVSRTGRQAGRNTQIRFFQWWTTATNSGEPSVCRSSRWQRSRTLASRPMYCRFESRPAAAGARCLNSPFFFYWTLVQILPQTFAPPPPKKMVSSFRGVEASKSKNPLGGQNNDFTRALRSLCPCQPENCWKKQHPTLSMQCTQCGKIPHISIICLLCKKFAVCWLCTPAFLGLPTWQTPPLPLETFSG